MDVVSIDLFAGGGGASEGILRGTGRAPIIAVNHDDEALKMHAANHPGTLHLCENVLDVDPIAPGGRLDLLWASPDCFPAGTTVLTTRGCIPIEEVREGDRVLTHRNRWRNVTSTMKSMKELREIRGYGHHGLRVSLEHPFLVKSRRQVWNNTSRSYDRIMSDAAWVSAKDIVPLHPGTGGVPEGHYWSTPHSVEKLPIPEVGGRGMVLDENLMWLAGMYLADGWSRLTDTRAELVITCGRHEMETRREQLGKWPRKGLRAAFNEISWYERDSGTAIQFSSTHRGLVEWLRENMGHLAHNKRVPAWILGAPRSFREAFLSGYLEGDGHRRDGLIMASTVSPGIAFGLRILVTTLGRVASVYRRFRPDTIQGRKVHVRPAYTVRYLEGVSEDRTQHVADDAHVFTPIRSVEDVSGLHEVYNLSVEEDESYVADGIVVHNCTFFSRARGGKPMDKNIRALPWVVVKWAKAAQPRVICMENVAEIEFWGPLYPSDHPDPKKRDRPIPERRGETFRQFIRQIQDAGYDVEWRTLRASDYGAPTTRERFFLIARSDGLPIVWPEPTHGPGRSYPHRAAAECIDWDLPCPSIFLSKQQAAAWARAERERGNHVGTPRRPLQDNTLARIAEGMRRYVINAQEPFLLNLTHGGRLEPLSEPFKTITGAHRGEKALITPLLIQTRNGERPGQTPRTRNLRDPLNTITAQGSQGALVTAFLQSTHSHPVYRSAEEPVATITASAGGHQSLISAFLIKYYGQGVGQDMKSPMHTITSRERFGLVHAFLTKFYGTSTGSSLHDPMPTVTGGGQRGGGHLGVVTVTVRGQAYAIADIGMRMLTPRELARAQGFQEKYILTGSRSNQIARIGNSVPPPVVEAIVRAQFGVDPDELEIQAVA